MASDLSSHPFTIRPQLFSKISGFASIPNAIDGSHIAIGTAQGDIMYYDGTNWVRLAAGTNTHVLTTTGAGANPYWAAGSSGTALPGVGADGNVLTSDGTKTGLFDFESKYT